ncbi:MAG: DUF2809 domain-containing protein [Bacteroidota bacterium]
MIFPPTKRWPYFLAVILIIPIGLLIRKFEGPLSWIGLHGPDALYATMIYWGCRGLAPKKSPWLAAGITAAFCFGVEFLQLYKAPWILKIRSYKLGGLILGYGFQVVDLFRYLGGIGLGLLLEKWRNRS